MFFFILKIKLINYTQLFAIKFHNLCNVIFINQASILKISLKEVYDRSYNNLRK